MTTDRAGKTVVERAIEEWYSAAWHRGVRLTGIERQYLADSIAQRTGEGRDGFGPPRPPVSDTRQTEPVSHEEAQ